MTKRALDASAHASLADLATRVNTLLHASTPSNKFATAFLLSYHPATGQCTYVNGGHNDGIVHRNLLASYSHLRSGAGSDWARRFVAFAATVAALRGTRNRLW